jgi:hypothetical protein
MSARRVTRVWPVVVALALALVIPAGASAARTYVTHAGFSTTGLVHGTNGFKLQFWESSRRKFKATVKGHHQKTVYETEGGAVSGGRVSARLGGRGTFDLRFVPIGKPRFFRPPRWCRGPAYRWQLGFLVGHFAFRGERHYTRARGVRVPAARESWSPLRCHYLTGSERHAAKDPRIHVGGWSYEKGHALSFGAALFHRQARPLDRRVEFRASLYEQSGPLTIEREVEVAAPEASISFPGRPDLPEEAVVSPPAPFVGTAEFLRTPESNFTWTGDLAVDFRGLGRVRLAGPRFGARMCMPEGCISRDQDRDAGEPFASR